MSSLGKAFLSIALGLIFAEMLARLAFDPPTYVRAVSLDPPYQDMPNLYLNTPRGPRMRARVRVEVRNNRLSHLSYIKSTNSLGLFGPEPSRCFGGCIRLMILGDSVINQDFLPEEESIVHILRETLKTKLENIDVLNAGISGLSMEDEIIFLEDKVAEYRPTHVILVSYLNDAVPSSTIFIPTIPRWVTWSRYVHLLYVGLVAPYPVAGRNSKGLDQFSGWAEASKRISDLKNNPTYREFADSLGGAPVLMWSHRTWSDLSVHLERFGSLAKEHKFRPLVALSPIAYQVRMDTVDTFPQQAMGELAQRFGMPFLDLLPDLREQYSVDKSSPFFDECHAHAQGSVTIAQSLASFFLEQLESEGSN